MAGMTLSSIKGVLFQSSLEEENPIRQQPLRLFSGHGVCGQDIWQKRFWACHFYLQ